MFVSILGDSISTYPDFVPAAYSVFYQGENLDLHQMHSVYDTWWAKVNQFLKAYLCVNDSYSGSAVAGLRFPAACSQERINALSSPANTPDIILIYLGVNDFARGYSITGHDTLHFEYAYEAMLQQIKSRYPRSWIFCGTLMEGYIPGQPDFRFSSFQADAPLDAYNDAIRRACRKQNCQLADLAAQQVAYETLDGVHPTKKGHAAIAQCWIHCLSRNPN